MKIGDYRSNSVQRTWECSIQATRCEIRRSMEKCRYESLFREPVLKFLDASCIGFKQKR